MRSRHQSTSSIHLINALQNKASPEEQLKQSFFKPVIPVKIEELRSLITELKEIIFLLERQRNQCSPTPFIRFFLPIFIMLAILSGSFWHLLRSRNCFFEAKEAFQEGRSSLIPNKSCGEMYPYLNSTNFITIGNARNEMDMSRLNTSDAVCFMLAMALFEGPGMFPGYLGIMVVIIAGLIAFYFIPRLTDQKCQQDFQSAMITQVNDPQGKLKKAANKFNIYPHYPLFEFRHPPSLENGKRLKRQELKIYISLFKKQLKEKKAELARCQTEIKEFLLAGHRQGSTVQQFFFADPSFEPKLSYLIANYVVPDNTSAPAPEKKNSKRERRR